MRWGPTLAATALLSLGACRTQSHAAPPSPPAMAQNATVKWVVDGDTLDVDIRGHRERVRLIGIDTPETKKPDTPVQCFGPEASHYTETLLPGGTPLHVERDVQARDDYGRLLAYVYRLPDGLFVNLAVIANGYARPLTIPPNVAHSAEFVDAATQARERDKGLWHGCAASG